MTVDPLLVIKIAYCAIFVACALTDFWVLRIPNLLVLALLALFAAAALYAPQRFDPWAHLVPAVVVFALGAALFAWGKFGGGDVKLLAVAVLWAGMPALPVFLVMLGFAGLVLLLVFQRGREPLSAAALYVEQATGGRIAAPRSLFVSTHVPYGVVIAAAALVSVNSITFLR